MAIVTGDGRSLDYLRAAAPRRPSRLAFIIDALWPLQSVELWRALGNSEKELRRCVETRLMAPRNVQTK